MANQILVNPFPFGSDPGISQQTVSGSIMLCGSAVATGEPLNWANMLTGLSFNEVNFAGNGQAGQNGVYVTALSASAGTITATANNNFSALLAQGPAYVTFANCTTTLGLLLNGLTFQIATASSTQFTFAATQTGTGTSETGLALSGTQVFLPLARPRGPAQNLTITAFSASGGVVTVTAANKLLPGAQVTITSAGSGSTIGGKLNGVTVTVASATASAFTTVNAATGSTTTGTGVGINPPTPFSVKFWSALNSGYIYQYSETFGTLFVDGQTSSAAAGDPLAKIAAAAYPAGVLADVIKYEAKFAKA